MANLHDRKCFLKNHLKPLDSSIPNTEECIICTETATSPVQLPCGGKHIYCNACIQKWLQDHNTCPMCRQVLFKENRVQLDWFGGMHYSLNIPPPAYDNSMAAEMEVASFLEARVTRMERQMERMVVTITVEEDAENDWNVGLLTWASRSAEIMAEGAANFFEYLDTVISPELASRRGGST